ncbi:MAG: ACT domain-containing protein [Gracilibacteraceae bacterium]|nr:ACT domain-containing protein [Gracilibacteraceae bacterium]
MAERALTMELMKGLYGVCRLNSDEVLPEWALQGSFYSITKTSDELSVVCPQDNIPKNIICEKDWRILRIIGPLDFSLIGILSSISTILAKKGISIFAVSTYDTDYILVRDKDTGSAIEALSAEKYEIIR